MARISTYPLDNDVVGTDKWIGTDSSGSNLTKNFSADAVAAFLNTNGIVETQALRYNYQNVEVGDTRLNSTISFSTTQGDTVAFAGITGWMISKYAKPSKLVETFYTSPLVGQQILITNADNPSDWGVFSWDSSVVNSVETDFYDIGLTLISSTGNLVNGQGYLISLIYNSSGTGDKNFIYTQGVASASWTVVHNLNKFPSVSIVDSANEVVYGNIDYLNVNELTITFQAAFAGKAYMN